MGTSNSGHVATLHNAHLSQFMSQIPEPQALVIDALSQDWQGRSMYMFPPFPLLNKVIQKTTCHQGWQDSSNNPLVAMKTVVPTSTSAVCVDHPRIIPYRRDLFSQQGFASVGKSYHLLTWRLLYSTTKQQDF